MSDSAETHVWVPVAIKPTLKIRCIVHAFNNVYRIAMFDSGTQQFWDKDGQPVVGVIEWTYQPDRDE